MENIGSTGWKVFNTLASAAGIAMSATALGVKANTAATTTGTVVSGTVDVK